MKNKSLSWETIAALSPAFIFGVMAKQFFPVEFAAAYPELVKIGGLTMCTTAGIYLAHDYISAKPERKLKVLFENTGLYIKKDAGIRLPKLRKKDREKWGYQFLYKMPNGLCEADFKARQEKIEAALDAEISIATKKGLLKIEAIVGEIPTEIKHTGLGEEGGEIPFVIGYSRKGWVASDLVKGPHLLVAGETGAGKSTFLHQFIYNLPSSVELYVIDLKMVEFSYIENVASTLDAAIATLEKLTAEMQRRMRLLSKAKCENLKQYRLKNEKLPYIVLIVDEFSQLSPVLSKDKQDRAMRSYAHKMLIDLICLARALGIHLLVATQRPDSEILPGQLKANIPAVLCFKVKNATNSKIVLDNDKAARLPVSKEIPGRAIWQHEEEMEVQTPLIKVSKVREKFESSPPSTSSISSPHTSSSPGRFLMPEGD